MVTPQELNMVCGESNEINGEKIVLSFTPDKKNCLLLIMSEKNCTFKLAVEKSLITEKKHSPPCIKWSAPKGTFT